MMEAMKTSSHRSSPVMSPNLFPTDIDANKTTFWTREGSISLWYGWCSRSSNLSTNRWFIYQSATSREMSGSEIADRIIGCPYSAGQSFNGEAPWFHIGILGRWDSNESSSHSSNSRLQGRGSIDGGAAKLASNPTATNLTFRKPIVDYHAPSRSHQEEVIIPLVQTWTILQLATQTSGTIQIRTESRQHGFIESICTIYHGIFRINPKVLEQIYYSSAEKSAWMLDADRMCNESIIPRHFSMMETGMAKGGWGLHQITPFRPIHNTSMQRISEVMRCDWKWWILSTRGNLTFGIPMFLATNCLLSLTP